MKSDSTPLWVYLAAFAGVLALTFVNVEAARHDLGAWNVVIVLVACSLQVLLVGGVLMHLGHSAPVLKVLAGASLLWTLFMVVITFGDYVSRPWQGQPLSWEASAQVDTNALAAAAVAIPVPAGTNTPPATAAITNAPVEKATNSVPHAVTNTPAPASTINH
jgi:caa(3)-type oxidase subunit IV